MRHRRTSLMLAWALVGGCGQPSLPVWYLPADPALTATEIEQRTSEVLTGLGYQIESFDPRLALLRTRWQHDGRLLSTRCQVQIRFKRTPPYGLALTVPTQIHDGADWVPDGEDARRRKQLVASLIARLALPAEAGP